MRRTTLFCCLFLIAPLLATPARAQEADLAPLLQGFERCHANKAFEALQEAIRQRFANNHGEKVARNDTRVKLPLPDAVKAAVGAPRSILHEDHTEVIFPLSGRFQGLRVAALKVVMGNENGIGWRLLEFAEPVGVVRQRFAASLTAAQKRINTSEGTDVTFLVPDKPPAAILCDFSN